MQVNRQLEVFRNPGAVRTPRESIADSSSGPEVKEPRKMMRGWIYTFDPDRGHVLKIEHLGGDDGETRRELSVAEYAALAASLGLVAGPLLDPALAADASSKRDEWVYFLDEASGSVVKIEKTGADGRRTELAFEEYADLAANYGIFAGPFASHFFYALANAYYQGYTDGQATAYS